MRQVFSVSKGKAFPSWKQWKQLPRVLNPLERRVLLGCLSAMVISLVWIGGWYVATHRTEIPTAGGTYTEALIGEPQYINPLYATSSDVDADLTRLVYSGLLKWDPTQGLIFDLASNIAVSEDGKTYTVTIRDNAYFHNGDPVRARDVIFTIDAIQNPQYRSPLAVSFRGVLVSQVDDKTIAFQLEEPFAPFLSTLTVGILPADVWGDIEPRNAPLASRNLEPVGSGPYRFSKFTKDKSGTILSYTLKRNEGYYGEQPLVGELVFKFYADADEAIRALENRNVEGVSFVPSDAEPEVEKNHSVTLLRPSIPREIVLYFNPDQQAAFDTAELRKAIAMAIDKTAVLNAAVHGHGRVIDAPILPGMIGEHPDVAKIAQDIAGANTLLDALYPKPEGAAYRLPSKDATEGELTFTVKTVQSPEFVQAAQTLADQLKAIGIRLDIVSVPGEEFFASVIDPRDYEMLLTGVLLGVDPDPYPFWHSSQAREGGLNLAQYGNRKADTLLEEARSATDAETRATKYREFQDLLAADIPAIFLYQSTYSYAISTKVRNVTIDRIATPADRFANVTSWYVKTRKTLK